MATIAETRPNVKSPAKRAPKPSTDAALLRAIGTLESALSAAGLVGIPRRPMVLPARPVALPFAPGPDRMRAELAERFDDGGFPVATPKPVAPVVPADIKDITRHDGFITATNPATGNTARFRVETIDGGALDGRRVASIRDGSKWTGFAFVDSFGVHVWRRLAGTPTDPSDFDRYARFLGNLGNATRRGVELTIVRS